ncbi:MAG: methyltransferase domain-containing protein, partial [Gemmatimonadetes bacterium]|nr:methyltransferase domain-containing protein [Gemmatimonadota bacterium]NIS34010.1 methyltransferase domain-containing protein [Actinomycetota bacterium]NIU68816.1 methyltransferase domain-containing protein [Actinomycetota bacterium]NIW30667.1 methyltransferase domain-containing protein [Actinomycetota bacterium]NIX23069.1 methyltransferase domain-containing protein [Actinomycetota bacterium]
MGKETEGKEETPGQKDPEKGRIRTDWQAKGPSWDRWADVVGETADRLNDPLVDAAGVARGETVLDLASGTGEPALNVARRVGADGLVVATDLAEEMLAGARRRAAAAGLAHLGFAVADMEALPFPGRRFDRVTCRFGI